MNTSAQPSSSAGHTCPAKATQRARTGPAPKARAASMLACGVRRRASSTGSMAKGKKRSDSDTTISSRLSRHDPNHNAPSVPSLLIITKARASTSDGRK